MKKLLCLFLCVTFLGGCNQLVQQLQIEKSLADSAKTEVAAKCKDYGDTATEMPNSRKNAVKFQSCIAGIVNKELVPRSMFGDLLLASGAAELSNAKEYRDGKIDREELQSRKAENSAELMQKMQGRIQQSQQQQADSSQRAFQNLVTMQQLQNQRDAINRANRPVTTTCNGLGYSVNCTTW